MNIKNEAKEILGKLDALVSIFCQSLPGKLSEKTKNSAVEDIYEYIQKLLCTILIMDSEVQEEESQLLKELSSESGFGENKEHNILTIYQDIFEGESGNINQFIITTPDFIHKIISYDKRNGTSLSLEALTLISDIGRTAIAIDGVTLESEVDALLIHLNSLQTSLQESNAPLSVNTEEDEVTEGKGTASSGSQQKKSASKKSQEKIQKDQTLDELLYQLSGLVGLQDVKREVASLVNLLKIKQMREERGLPSLSMSHHLVFTGNPGTGKTIVARLLSEIYKSLGLLESGHLIEVDRSGLVAGYLGQTSLKVKDVIKESLGGVLFIDEAYSLANGEGESDYGQEAIDILVKEMEDNRKDFIVIAAGYPDKMSIFIKSNPGLRARFNKYINFPDYSPEEMFEIFCLMCTESGYKLADSAEKRAQELFEDYCVNKSQGFANAREARNIFEKCVQMQANRIVNINSLSGEKLSLIEECDLLF